VPSPTPDIAAWREAEQALRESEERYRTLVETASDVILSFDAQGHLTFANQAVREVLGVEPEDMVGRHFRDLLAPEDIGAAEEQFRDTIHGEAVIGRAARMLARDGREVIVRFNAAPLRDAEGEIVGIMCIGRDETESRQRQRELEQSRTQLQQIVDGTTSTIHIKDLDGRYLLVNKQLERTLGRPREELLGRTDAEVLEPPGAKRSRDHDLAALRAGGPVEREGPMPCAGGMRTYLMVRFPLFDSDGQPYAVCGIGTDISDRKRAEEEIGRLASERARLIARSLESEERERRRISEALHDEVVQTLLAVRQDLIEAQGRDGGFLERAAAGIERTLEQLRATIRELHPVALAHSDLPSALRSVTREIGGLGELELELDIDEKAQGGPDELLLAAARELVLNVVKHSDSQRARVALGRVDGEVVLEVADEGVGIPEGRLESARGHGHIGLAALQERVTEAGGRFELDTSPGSGTRVQVAFPYLPQRG
jgi:PAS domain S-box-containing protein